MTYEIEYAYTSHVGKIRANNEDNFWCCGESLPAQNFGTSGIFAGNASQKTLPVLAVFDGMGGESCGEVAAETAVREFGRFYGENREKLKKFPEEFLEEVCDSMNRQVVRYGEENRIGSMGTTTAFAAFSRDGVYVGNLGDSRVYCSEKDRFQQISVDHVIGRSFLGKPPLTQYLGIMEEGLVLEPCITKHPYVAGNRYLLCSDGMTDMLSDGEIADILTREIPLEETVSVLLERVLEKGGRDNVTISLCEIKETEKRFWSRWKKHSREDKLEAKRHEEQNE